jgi:hypothetical protein
MILFLKYLTFFKKSNCHPSNFLITIDPTKSGTRKVRKKKLFSPCPNMWSGDQGKFDQFLILLELKKAMTQFHSGGEATEYFSSPDPSFVMVQRLTSLLSHLYKSPLLLLKRLGPSPPMVNEDHPYLIILGERIFFPIPGDTYNPGLLMLLILAQESPQQHVVRN